MARPARRPTGNAADFPGRNSYNGGMKAAVSQKGQVTIPKKLRDRLGIRPGELLDFQEEEGKLVARKATARDPLEAVYGIVDLGRSTDSFIDDLRGEPDKR
jgi:antitoxin PrlF